MPMTHDSPRKKRKGASYARISTDGQDLMALTGQQVNCRRHVEMLGDELIDEFADPFISGGTDERPQFRTLMMRAFSPEKPYDFVIVEDIARLTRGANDYMDYERLFAEHEVELISLMEPSSSRTKIDTARRMKAVMNEDFLAAVALRTREGQFLATEMGFHIGGVPFGYRKVKVSWRNMEHSKLEPDPETFEDLLWLIDMGKRDYTLGEIIEELEKAGVKRPDKRQWTRENLSYLLKNRALLGWTSRGWETGNGKYLFKAEPVICKTAHQSAMTEEERDLIIQNLASRRRTLMPPRVHRSANPLKKKVFCGFCGGTMTVQTSDRYVKLVCSKNRKGTKKDVDGKRQRCPNKRVPLDMLLEALLAALLNHVLTEKVVQREIKMVEIEEKDNLAHKTALEKQIDKRLGVLNKETDNIIATIAEYGPKSKILGEELQKREDEMKLLNTQKDLIREEKRDTLDFINDRQRTIANALDLRTYLETEDPHDLHRMLNHLIQRVSIIGKEVTVDYLIPLPKNKTEEPILSEIISLDKEKRPFVGQVGVNRGENA